MFKRGKMIQNYIDQGKPVPLRLIINAFWEYRHGDVYLYHGPDEIVTCPTCHHTKRFQTRVPLPENWMIVIEFAKALDRCRDQYLMARKMMKELKKAAGERKRMQRNGKTKNKPRSIGGS
jgi:hypothetical protein